MPFKSAQFTMLQQSGFVADIPLPLPADYISGFDKLLHNAAQGGGPAYEQTYPGVNVLGRYFANGPVWYYYLAGLVFKMPLLVISLMIAAVVMLVKRNARWQLLRRHVQIWLPAVVFFVLLSVTNPFQIGIRHIMPVLPFVYVAIAPAAVGLWQMRRTLALGMLFLHTVSVGRYGASMLAYTNEFVWNKKQVHRYLCDSSVSYGTGKKRAAKFMMDNTGYKYLPYMPVEGDIIIPVDALTGQRTAGANNATWLLAFEPVGHYAYDHLLYRVTEEDLKRAGYR
jgi:hypothetical protein